MARFNVRQAVEGARAASDTDHTPEPQKDEPKEKRNRQEPTSKPGRTTKPPRDSDAQKSTQDHSQSTDAEPAPAPPRKQQERRIAVPLPDDMRRVLNRARADDDIETTVRIRAMIELWQRDERLRTRVDKLARQRSSELIAHRWSRELDNT